MRGRGRSALLSFFSGLNRYADIPRLLADDITKRAERQYYQGKQYSRSTVDFIGIATAGSSIVVA